MGTHRWLSGKESACQYKETQEAKVQSLSWEDSTEEENGNPLQYFCLEKSHGERSLVGYSPWVAKNLERTEQRSTHVCTHVYVYIYLYILKNSEFLPISPISVQHFWVHSSFSLFHICNILL